MQRRTKSDAPGTYRYDETDVLTSPSLEDNNAPANSKSTSPSKRRKASNKKSWGVKTVITAVAIVLVILLLLDKFTPTPNLLLPHNNEKRAVHQTHENTASTSASLAPTESESESKAAWVFVPEIRLFIFESTMVDLILMFNVDFFGFSDFRLSFSNK
jgi:cytoskeletal protein RodZ